MKTYTVRVTDQTAIVFTNRDVTYDRLGVVVMELVRDFPGGTITVTANK